jgi:Fur family ferric uptake transcriptional regulator
VAILSILLSARKPQTAEEISGKLAKGRLNKVTIYRSLESFVAAGLVHKAFLRERIWHFELADNCSAGQCHPHFTCTDCGDTHCLPEITLPMAANPPLGFVIDRQRVQLEGLCPKCSSGF